MKTLLVVAGVIIATMLLWQWLARNKVRAMNGKPVPDTSEVDGGNTAKRKVYFFHATYCGPCKSIMPLVDEIKQEHANLIKVNVSEHLDLARAFKLAGTPSFYAVDEGIITETRLGLTDEQWLRRHLEVQA